MTNPLNAILDYDDVQEEFTSKPRNNTKSARPDVILQNATPGHHCVTDRTDKDHPIDLYFEPFGVIDLTWFDPSRLRRCTALQKSMIDGYLVPITREEHDSILHAESLRQRDEAMNAMNPNNKRRTRTFEIDGKEIEAEVVNLNKVDSASAQASISSAGQSNDPTSFSIAFNRARKEYAMQGMNLSARTFHEMSQKNTGLIKQYLRKEQDDAPLANTVFSGESKPGKFYVAGQQGQVDQYGQPLRGGTKLKGFGQEASSAQQELYRSAASVDDAFDPDDESDDHEPPMAQMIDLNTPDDSDDLTGFGSGGGGVRRL